MRTMLWSIALLPLALAACGDASAPAPRAEQSAASPVPVSGPERTILAFGDSLFAGYGLDSGQSYPAQLETALCADGVNVRIANAGVSGDTSAAGRERLAFTLDSQAKKPDLVLLELGGNDMLRGLSPQETRANFDAMLGELKERGIPVLLMGMRAPPNYGPEYQQDFDAIYPALAEQYGAKLVPFWMEAIYQNPSLFQADRLHPTKDGIGMLVKDTLDDVQGALPPVAS